MQFKGQVFGENAKGSDMYAHDLLPLSERYADYARNYFSVETALKISEEEEKIMMEQGVPLETM